MCCVGVQPHHWGEPLYGYYLADDDWVVRKHGSLLADAGVDFICFDMTNAVTYDNAWRAVFSGWSSMRAAGNPTPNIAIVLHSGTNETVSHMYEQLYKPGLYRELWQMWDGKPLILGNSSEVTDPTIRAFFTWRLSWAWTVNQPWFGDGRDAWPWIDFYPQGYGWHSEAGRKEEMPIAVAGWPTLNLGKSYDGYSHTQPAWGTANTAVGHYFRQQFEWALNATCHDNSFHCDGVQAADSSNALPQAVFITGWNEWFAGRFIVGPTDVVDFCGERLQAGESYFVDEYIEEYSRDIEAMRGGHGDNYYYQLVAMVRWLKGAEAAVPSSSSSILPPTVLPATVGELLSELWWSAAGQLYYDTVNDTNTRSHAGFGDSGLYYSDNSTVDDLCEAQLAVPSSDQSMWVTRIAACHSFNPAYSNTTRPPPLTVFILVTNTAAVDGSAASLTTMGYNYKLNVSESTLYTAALNSTGGADWRPVRSNITLVWDDSQLIALLPIPLSTGATIDFKWWSGAEWAVVLSEPIEFMLYGDAAPNARFNYRYEVVQQQQSSERASYHRAVQSE